MPQFLRFTVRRESELSNHCVFDVDIGFAQTLGESGFAEIQYVNNMIFHSGAERLVIEAGENGIIVCKRERKPAG
jgi:hypothetical protein